MNNLVELLKKQQLCLAMLDVLKPNEIYLYDYVAKAGIDEINNLGLRDMKNKVRLNDDIKSKVKQLGNYRGNRSIFTIERIPHVCCKYWYKYSPKKVTFTVL
jgi:hypothetical protein